MWKRGERARRAREPLPLELCDQCGATFPQDEAERGWVPDSSSVHPTNDWFDGLRRVTACSDAHLAAVREEYRRRDFVPEELWAAKIDRALGTGGQVTTLEELGRRTGLHEPEIRRAVAWHNARRRRQPPP
ncbi:hypothetical protein ACF09J_28020 [Streptomyces sp. NPDC014889]|uniref:hypothetical protein n=1 Tax=Streptomyces sp. NPDC014889 TaxID=3364928 RepID=UPI0036FBE92E